MEDETEKKDSLREMSEATKPRAITLKEQNQKANQTQQIIQNGTGSSQKES